MAFARVSSCRRAAASESGSGRTGGCSLVIGFLVPEGGDDLVQVAGDLPVHLGDADVACGFGGGDDLQGGLPLGMVLREELGGRREHRASQTRVRMRAGLDSRELAVAVWERLRRAGQLLAGPGGVAERAAGVNRTGCPDAPTLRALSQCSRTVLSDSFA